MALHKISQVILLKVVATKICKCSPRYSRIILPVVTYTAKTAKEPQKDF